MKKKVLLSSIATIVLCLCLIAGSTFALFTSEEKFDISVTSGKVNIDATAKISGVYSASRVESTNDPYLYDEQFQTSYEHADQKGNTFANGGTADLTNNTLTIDRLTPGDRVDVTINVDNYSNVAISYRYAVSVVAGEKLASGMVVSVGDDHYEGLKTFASEWTYVESGAIPSLTISFQLPVYAGNKYQDLNDLKYSILVYAVQGNAALDSEAEVTYLAVDSDSLNNALANGGDIVAETTFDNLINVENGVDASLDLNDNAINNNVEVQDGANITISNGTINGEDGQHNDVAIQNFGGNVVVENVDMNAGSNADYSNISHGGSIKYDNVNITANGGGVGVTGGYAEFNSGSLEIVSNTTSPRYNFYVTGNGTELVINGGDFSFSAPSLKRAYIYVGEGATVTINGGNFGEACKHPSKDYNGKAFLGAGEIIITGGTFGFNPSSWVADGYHAVQGADGIWTVVAN